MKFAVRFRLRNLALIVLLAPYLCHASPHPTRVDERTNCLECHADRATGVYVHAAVQQGCTSCHNIENRADASYVVLRPTNSVLCFDCHEPAKVLYPHLLYSSGMCTRCHDPHVSANPRLLHVKVNELCLSCHLRTPNSVPSGYLPTIALDADNRLGHPYQRHPVKGSNDQVRGGEMSCISCHLPHGGMKLHHLRMASEIPEDALNQNTETNDMCRKCHLRMWGLEGVAEKKKNKKNKVN